MLFSLGCWVGFMKTAKTRESRIIILERGFHFENLMFCTLLCYYKVEVAAASQNIHKQHKHAQWLAYMLDATFWAAKVVWAKIIIVRIIKCSFDQSDLDYRVIITFSCWGKESSASRLKYLGGVFYAKGFKWISLNKRLFGDLWNFH